MVIVLVSPKAAPFGSQVKLCCWDSLLLSSLLVVVVVVSLFLFLCNCCSTWPCGFPKLNNIPFYIVQTQVRFFGQDIFSGQGWRKIHFRNVYWNRLLWCFLFVGERFSMYLMLFVDRSLRFSVVLWTDHSEWYIVLWIVHSDFMLCCGSITRNDILCCGSFTPIFRYMV